MTSRADASSVIAICDALPALKAKFIVDTINGLDVAADHVRVQHSRMAFSSRIIDAFTGKGARRQTEINARLQQSLESAVTWIKDLTYSQAKIVRDLTVVAERTRGLETCVTRLAEYSLESRKNIQILKQAVEEKLQATDAELYRIKSVLQAQLHLEKVLSAWAAGQYDDFSLAGQCFTVVMDLYWGAFGHACRLETRERETLLTIAINRVSAHLLQQVKNVPSQRPSIDMWLANGSMPELHQEALGYLAAWAVTDRHPFTCAVADPSAPRSIYLPVLCTANRLGKALFFECYENREESRGYL